MSWDRTHDWRLMRLARSHAGMSHRWQLPWCGSENSWLAAGSNTGISCLPSQFGVVYRKGESREQSVVDVVRSTSFCL